MSTSKNKPRFTVEFIETKYAIFDATTWTYTLCPPGTSKSDAEQQCAERNGILPAKKPREPSISQRFREHGVTFEELDAHDVDVARARARLALPDHVAPLIDKREQREQRVIDNYRKWLPRMLRLWADQVAEALGYAGLLRTSLHPDIVMRALKKYEFDGSFKNLAVRTIHEMLWPNGIDLAVHYLSPETAEAKANYFQMSKSTYLRRVRTAHELLARQWINGHAMPDAWLDNVWENTDESVPDDDEYQFHWESEDDHSDDQTGDF